METNPLEPQPKKRPARRRLQFSMRALLLAPLILVIYVGLAVIIDAYAFSVSCRVFGMWLIDARHWLIGLGFSTDFVTSYLGLALVRLPGWLVLASVAFLMGLRRCRRAHLLAWLLALAFPLSELILDSWLAASGLFGEADLFLNFNVRIVSAFGFVVGVGAWSIGWFIRGRRYDLAAERRPTWFSRVVQVVIWTFVLAVSIYGWTALARLR
ncbi:MAG: hypothetical protein GXX96_02890 [Planctomycetaceae bacterium]|jgi:hypothetical protein|nr:hypothetical protein [Planctomycetaceae bacterium]